MVWPSNRLIPFLWDVARCDGCVAAHLGLKPNKAHEAVQRWVRQGITVRERAECPGCKKLRLVTKIVPALFCRFDRLAD